MSVLLANRLKSRRLELKLSQSELADGICEQAQVSRIEQGNYSPGAELLYKLSKKLNVSVEYFFDESVDEKSINLEKFREISRKYISSRDYEGLKYIYDLEVKRNKKIPLFDKFYLSWIEAIISYRCYNNLEEAITKMENILLQLKEQDSMYISIATSLSCLYFESEKLELYEKLNFKLLEIVSNIRIDNIEELYSVIKFKYNYCRHLWIIKDDRALSTTVSTIEFCKTYRTSYLLADLHCILGNIIEEFSLSSEARENYIIANILYKVDGNKEMYLETERYLNKLN